jgi:hypothetical protein
MGWVISLLISLFTAFTSFFVQHVSRKLAVSLSGIALFVTLTSIFLIYLSGLITTISVSLPTEMNIAISWFMPTNLPLCISTYYAAVVAHWVYMKKKDILKTWTY